MGDQVLKQSCSCLQGSEHLTWTSIQRGSQECHGYDLMEVGRGGCYKGKDSECISS